MFLLLLTEFLRAFFASLLSWAMFFPLCINGGFGALISEKHNFGNSSFSSVVVAFRYMFLALCDISLQFMTHKTRSELLLVICSAVSESLL